MGVLAEQSLTRNKEAPPADPDLTAVGMTGEGEVDAAVGQQIDVHIGLVAQEDLVAVLFKKGRQPVLVVPHGHPAEGKVKIPDRYGDIGVIEQDDARSAEELTVGIEQLLLMVAEAHIDGSNLHRLAQESANVLLVGLFLRRHQLVEQPVAVMEDVDDQALYGAMLKVVLRPVVVALEGVARDHDKVGIFRTDHLKNIVAVTLMQIGHMRDAHGSAERKPAVDAVTRYHCF